MTEYKTVENECSDNFVEKKSKFIGYATPVHSVAEANDFISKIKSKHWDATHNVSAYILKDNFIQRYSDDGEPNGTAGVPVLDVLIKENLVDVCVVATRYFGGILLGAGGLVRAYSHTSKIAVQSANIITMAQCVIAEITVDYSFYDRINVLLNKHSISIDNTEFLDNIKITVSIKEDLFSIIQDELTQISNGKYLFKQTGTKFSKI